MNASRLGAPLTALMAVVLVSGCGGGGSTSSGTPAPTAVTSSAAPAPSTPAGSGNCAAITKEDVTKYGLMAQLIPQVQDKSSLDAIRSQVLTTYTPDDFAAFLATLQFLRGNTSALGDPAVGLDYYAQANEALRALLDNPSPSAADFASYRAVVGDPASSIMKQAAVNAALIEACPELG